ncbi:sulfurtransferase complex subunit TusC [Buchnera aphidicola]|uniref:sulfurtransferase complex subunit TusC n=1 Tax=Buchnera aphidicola TaxID=9 RepID=UPI00313D2358
MKKSIAFFFSKGPYGNSITKEGLDILLSLSLTMKKISIFFIEDGIFQLLKSQKPEHVLLKNYVSAFKILPLYGVCDFFFV